MGEQYGEANPPIELQLRRSPLQDRAKQTVEKILDATAELLDDEGHENLTTERVAERSGVNIATLYHYFPNKLALLFALGQQFAEQQQERLESIFRRYREFAGELEWRDVVDAANDAILEFHRTVKGATAVSRAMQSYASLREIDRQQDLRQSEVVVSLLSELGIKGSFSELQTMALVIFQTATAVLDNALRWSPENADAAMDEVKIMHKQYIEYYIKQSADDSSTEGTARQKPE